VKAPFIVVETERLALRWLCPGDSGFVLELVNEPSWLQYIGDKGVHSLHEAESYIRNGPLDMYSRMGFGLYLVETKARAEPIGICGLIKREALEDVDLGFAFLPRFWGKRYAFEAASAVLSYARETLGHARIVAIASQDNHRSFKLLERLGFCFERLVRLAPEGEELKLYALGARPGIRADE
jgi:RimJ/RimL family protein N-acetyltransferase